MISIFSFFFLDFCIVISLSDQVFFIHRFLILSFF
ncbi:unnamed protein product [Brassica oleracea var. botrytis]